LPARICPWPAPSTDLDLAASLFEALSRATRRGRGIVRDSYGDGEQAAPISPSAADAAGLEVPSTDR